MADRVRFCQPVKVVHHVLDVAAGDLLEQDLLGVTAKEDERRRQGGAIVASSESFVDGRSGSPAQDARIQSPDSTAGDGRDQLVL